VRRTGLLHAHSRPTGLCRLGKPSRSDGRTIGPPNQVDRTAGASYMNCDRRLRPGMPEGCRTIGRTGRRRRHRQTLSRNGCDSITRASGSSGLSWRAGRMPDFETPAWASRRRTGRGDGHTIGNRNACCAIWAVPGSTLLSPVMGKCVQHSETHGSAGTDLCETWNCPSGRPKGESEGRLTERRKARSAGRRSLTFRLDAIKEW